MGFIESVTEYYFVLFLLFISVIKWVVPTKQDVFIPSSCLDVLDQMLNWNVLRCFTSN